MEVEKIQNASELTVKVKGRLDTTTAPDLEKELVSFDGISVLNFDFSELEYISSAGLRVLLASLKKIQASGGTLNVLNANSDIREVFDVTGFSQLMNIK